MKYEIITSFQDDHINCIHYDIVGELVYYYTLQDEAGFYKGKGCIKLSDLIYIKPV